MSVDYVRAKIDSLRNAYPNDFRIMFSPEDIDKNKLDVLNSELHGPFEFGDMRFTEVIEQALIAGKQVALQSGGQDKVIVLTAKSGGKLFDSQQPSRHEMVNVVMNSLEEMHDRYIGSDGSPLLRGGFDSYIYPERFAGIAEKYGYPKYRSYDIADSSILSEVRRRLESRQTVIVAAWTKENRIDVYAESQGSPQSTTVTSPNLTANAISVLAAIAAFIFSFLLAAAIGGRGPALCCCPIITAGVVYFVAPPVIRALRKAWNDITLNL